jgi:extradiol dioxygenase family protein
MDELGSSIRHSDVNANVCCTSFFFEPSQTMFTIFYPIVRIDQPCTEIVRNFVYDNNATLERQIRLLPWRRVHDRQQLLRNLSIEKNQNSFETHLENNIDIYTKCHKNDLYDQQVTVHQKINIDSKRTWRVYTDHPLVQEYLTDEHYQFTDQPEQADIIFVMKQWLDFRHETLNDTLINQFPFENIITNKELLSLVARRWKSLFG